MPKKITTNVLIQQFNIVHGKNYDYTKVIYINSSVKVSIGCKLHGQ
jgi:hypothetical protein